MQIPIDPQWFHEWRRDNNREFKAMRKELIAFEARLQDSRYVIQKHNDQIGALITGMADTDRRLKSVEDVERIRASDEARDSKSTWTDVKKTALLAAVGSFVAGAGLFIWHLVSLYAKAQP